MTLSKVAVSVAVLAFIGACSSTPQKGGDSGVTGAEPPGDNDANAPAEFDAGGPCASGVWTGPVNVTYEGRYAGLDTMCGALLAQRLCALVTTGASSVTYTEARQLVLNTVDVENGQVLGVYDGLWHTPSHVELNIEHTWPQSKGAIGDAKSDLHHLFATRSDFNSARSNLTFGVVLTRDWPTTLVGDPGCATTQPPDSGCYSFRGKDASGVEVFEPRDAQKGVTARAIFYFSVRYGQACAVRPLSSLDPAHPVVTEVVLKAWSAADPPGPAERTRNDRVEQIEKVRNPFIDHPELALRIAFQ